MSGTYPSRGGREGSNVGYTDRYSRPYPRRSVSPPPGDRYRRRRESRNSDDSDGRHDRYTGGSEYGSRGNFGGPKDGYRRERDDRGAASGSESGSGRRKPPYVPVDHKEKGREIMRLGAKGYLDSALDSGRNDGDRRGEKRKRDEDDVETSLPSRPSHAPQVQVPTGQTVIYIPPGSALRPITPLAPAIRISNRSAMQPSAPVTIDPSLNASPSRGPQQPSVPIMIDAPVNLGSNRAGPQPAGHAAASTAPALPLIEAAIVATVPNAEPMPNAAVAADPNARQLTTVIKGIYQATQCEDKVQKTRSYLDEILELRDRPNQSESDLAEFPALVDPAQASFAAARLAQVQAIERLKESFALFISNAIAGVPRVPEPMEPAVQQIAAATIPMDLLKSAVKELEEETRRTIVPQAQPTAVELMADPRAAEKSRRTKARFEGLDNELEAMRFALDELEQRVEIVEGKEVSREGVSLEPEGVEIKVVDAKDAAPPHCGYDNQEFLALKDRLQAIAQERAVDRNRMEQLEQSVSARDSLLSDQRSLMETMQQQFKDMMESHARLSAKVNIAQQDNKKALAAESAEREKLKLEMIAGRAALDKRDDDLQEGITQVHKATEGHWDFVQDEIKSNTAAIEESNKIKAMIPTVESLKPIWQADVRAAIYRIKLQEKKESEEAQKKAAASASAARETTPSVAPEQPSSLAPAHPPQNVSTHRPRPQTPIPSAAAGGSDPAQRSELPASVPTRPAVPLGSRIRPPAAVPAPVATRPPLHTRIDVASTPPGQPAAAPRKSLADRIHGRDHAASGDGSGLRERITSPNGR